MYVRCGVGVSKLHWCVYHVVVVFRSRRWVCIMELWCFAVEAVFASHGGNVWNTKLCVLIVWAWYFHTEVVVCIVWGWCFNVEVDESKLRQYRELAPAENFCNGSCWI